MRASKNQQVVDMRTKRFYNPETGFSSQADKARLHISNVNWSEHATIIKRCWSLIRNITTQPIISHNTNQFQSILKRGNNSAYDDDIVSPLLAPHLQPMILPGCQTTDSASSSKFHHLTLDLACLACGASVA